MASPAQAIAKLLHQAAADPDELTAAIRRGLPAASARNLAQRLQLDHRAAAAAFGIAPRTFSRRLSQRARLTALESDRAARLARVFNSALTVLGDEAKAVSWLHTPNRALGGARPLEQLDTDPGAIGVEDVLGRIAYGGYS